MGTNMTKLSGKWLLLAILAFSTGCASFANFGAGRERKDSGNSGQHYQVEMSNMVGMPTVYEGQLEKDMTVQGALERSGAIRRYRKMDVSVLRVVEGSGQPLKMVVQYNPGKKMVSPEQDYALLPGDRVIVQPSRGLIERAGSK